jgi:hypothetical protein
MEQIKNDRVTWEKLHKSKEREDIIGKILTTNFSNPELSKLDDILRIINGDYTMRLYPKSV